jgi:small-conductance mechanosensitive channel
VRPPVTRASRLAHPYAAALLAAVSVVVSAWLRRESGGAGALGRLAIALLPLPFHVYLVIALLRWTRRLDELAQRVQLEALAIALPATALVALTYGYLQRGGLLAPRPWDDVWLIALASYVVGYAIARRRYK